MKSKLGWGAMYAAGLLLCIVPAALAVIDRFGFWNTEQRVSATVILMLFVCAIPLWRQIKSVVKSFAENPSAWGVWLALTLVFWLFDAIAADMLVICYIALPSSVVGGVLMSVSHSRLKKEGDF